MKIHIEIESFEDISELVIEEQQLIKAAKAIAKKAYAPYSKFFVGAAVMLDNGEIVTGNNQENVAFPSGLCAERTALFYANAQYPDAAVKALAVAAYTNKTYSKQPITPCGSCRQVLLESENRHQKAIRVIMCGEDKIYVAQSAKDLLPLSFDSLF